MPERGIKSAIAKCTLYRSLAALVDRYSMPDAIETLAHIADEHKLLKTTELLDNAVDTALSEVST